jgi:hypothetical protein
VSDNITTLPVIRIERLEDPPDTTVPDGFILVPLEPTKEMLKAGCIALDKPDAQAKLMSAELNPVGSKRISVARTKMRLRWKAILSVVPPADRGCT